MGIRLSWSLMSWSKWGNRLLVDSGYRCFYGEGDGPTLSIYCLGRRIVQEGEDRHKCYFLQSAVHNAGISIRKKINNYKSANYILFLKGIISQNHVTHKLSNNFRIFICQYKKYSYICTLILGKQYVYVKSRNHAKLFKVLEN
jgi:hypothetical protein